MSEKPRLMSKFTHEIGCEFHEIEIDANKYWGKFCRKDKSWKYADMRRTFFWQVMAPHLGLPPDQWELFLKTFLMARKDREDLLMGAKRRRRKKEEFLYQAAIGIYLTDSVNNSFDENPGRYYLCDDNYREWREEEFARAISNLIGRGDHEAIRKLANIVEEKTVSTENHVKGWRRLKSTHSKESEPIPPGVETGSFLRWEIFCDHVIEKQALPTKKQVQDLWNADDSKANRYRNELGLAGLPQKK